MTIKTISKEDYNFLLKSQENYKNLTLQNKGYETINENKLTEEEKEIIKQIESILKNSITGFSSFQNFKIDKNGKIVIRLQYNYDADKKDGIYFIGVGYILIDELLNGFE